MIADFACSIRLNQKGVNYEALAPGSEVIQNDEYREGNFSGKQNIEDAQEFICCCNYGFFSFHSFGSIAEVQGIKGCIYADEVFKVRNGLDSFPAVSGLKIGNRMLSLPSSMLIRDLCPNQPIGNGESGGQTPLRARSPGVMSSPCFQFFGSIDSLIITKLYPNST